MALSDTACRNVKAAERPFKKADSGGLYLLVKPNGSRLWQMAYRFEGRQKTLSFGAYPTIGLAAARRKRDAAKLALSDGRDPGTLAEARSGELVDRDILFRTVANKWWETRRPRWCDAHAQRVWARLRDDMIPAIGNMPVHEISARDVLDALRVIEDRGALDIAKRVRQSTEGVFAYAKVEGLVQHNPATADLNIAMRPKPKAVHMPRLSEDQLPQFFSRLARWKGRAQTRLSIEFIMHTVVRTSELRMARLSEFEGDTWTIPAERMKMSRGHIVPLTPRALDILEALRQIAGPSEYLLPSRTTKTGIVQSNWMIGSLYKMGYKGLVTTHGFRGTFSTVLNDRKAMLGFDSDWIEMQLAHVEGNKVRGAYNAAEYLSDRRRMMEWWSGFLQAQSDVGDLL